MRAEFQIEVDGQDITQQLNDRLISLRVTDQPGLESDTCELRLDNRGAVLKEPPTGSALRVSIGWAGKGLTYLGTYYVSELKHAPAALTIHGKAIDMAAAGKVGQNFGYEATTLAAIVQAVAARMKLQPVCSVDVAVPRADQVNESDLNFITRMARLHGATATAKDGKLLVMPHGAGKAASGVALPPVALTLTDLSDYQFTRANRSSYDAVLAKAQDPATGKQIEVEARNPNGMASGGNVDILRHVYPNPASAQAAANARLQALNRATFNGSLHTAGRADIAAEKYIRLAGMMEQLNGDYLVQSVVHSYDGDSWRTEIEVNGGNGHKPDPARTDAAKPAAPPKLVVADNGKGGAAARPAALAPAPSAASLVAAGPLRKGALLRSHADFKVYLDAVDERLGAGLPLEPEDVLTAKSLLFNKYGYPMGVQRGATADVIGGVDARDTPLFRRLVRNFCSLSAASQEARCEFYSGIKPLAGNARKSTVSRGGRSMAVLWRTDFANWAGDLGVSADEALRKTDFDVYRHLLDAAFAVPAMDSLTINGAWRPLFADYKRTYEALVEDPAADAGKLQRMRRYASKKKGWSEAHVTSRALDLSDLNKVRIETSYGPVKDCSGKIVNAPRSAEPELVQQFTAALLALRGYQSVLQPWRLWYAASREAVINRGAAGVQHDHRHHLHYGLLP